MKDLHVLMEEREVFAVSRRKIGLSPTTKRK